MQINFLPNNNEKATGVCSVVRWTSRELQDAIRHAFHESPREQIVRIDIERDGITAYFEKRNC